MLLLGLMFGDPVLLADSTGHQFTLPGPHRTLLWKSRLSRASSGGPKEWGSKITTGSIVLCSQFFTCSNPRVDRCSNPFLGTPLVPLKGSWTSSACPSAGIIVIVILTMIIHIIIIFIIITTTTTTTTTTISILLCYYYRQALRPLQPEQRVSGLPPARAGAREGSKGGSQGLGVVSNNWLDRVLLSILYMLKPSC